MQHTPDLSNAVTAVVLIIALTTLGIGYARLKKPKKEKERVILGDEAKDFSAILQVILDANAPSELHKVYKMQDEFETKYTGVIPAREIKDYLTVITEQRNRRTLELLGNKITSLNAQAI